MTTMDTRAARFTTEPPSLLYTNTVTESASGRPLGREAQRDLLVDRLVAQLTDGRADYHIDGWLTTLVPRPVVTYRQACFADLQTDRVRQGLTSFSKDMQRVRRILKLTTTLYYESERQRRFLEAALLYLRAVRDLAETMSGAQLSSAAFRGLARWLDDYVASPAFGALDADAHRVRDQLDGIRYRVRVHGDWVEVRPVDPDEPELAARVLDTFERFRQDAPKSYLQEIRDPGGMDHVEAAIASFVARLFPGPFAALGAFSRRHDPFVPPALTRVERELQFYLAHLELEDFTRAAGVQWSLPEVGTDQSVSVIEAHDIALVLTGPAHTLVPNDCQLADDERVVVVTGPNQGGKTTFARIMGQLHLIAATGAPVPARRARLPIVDTIHTIFERGENLQDLNGHLHDDLSRAHALLAEVTRSSLVLLNEVYSSTSTQDALALGEDLVTRLTETGARTVCVTFLDELSRHSPETVSLVAGVDADDRTRRTYRIERRPADGLAYARALARQHGLSADDLPRRLIR